MKSKVLIVLLIYFLMTSCSNKQELTELENKKIELGLDRDYVRIWCGTAYTVDVLSCTRFTVTSDDPYIAEASIQDSKIIIRAKTPGQTNLTISEKGNPNNMMTLKCYSRVFADYWSEAVNLAKYYPNSAQIAADDKLIANVIKDELLLYASKQYGTRYYFDENTNKVTVSVYRVNNYYETSGTYSWDWANGVLTLSYDGKIETYRCDLMPPHPEFTTPPFVVAISQDFTAKYLAEYPDAGIEEVSVTRYLSATGDRWWYDGDRH